MKKACPKCGGTGSIVVDTKICETCDGTGYVDTFEMKNHFKGVNSNARAKFDLDADQDVPCEACNGKGPVDVMELVKLLFVTAVEKLLTLIKTTVMNVSISKKRKK